MKRKQEKMENIGKDGNTLEIIGKHQNTLEQIKHHQNRKNIVTFKKKGIWGTSAPNFSI